jgi:hypothetical protein
VNGMTRACSSVEWLIPLVCLSVRARSTCNSIFNSDSVSILSSCFLIAVIQDLLHFILDCASHSSIWSLVSLLMHITHVSLF